MEIIDDSLVLSTETECIELSFTPDTDELVEFSYYQRGSEGWGAGGGEYLSRAALRRLASDICGLMCHKTNRVDFAGGYCSSPDEQPVLNIQLSRTGEAFSLTVSMLETLERRSYITIEAAALPAEKIYALAGLAACWAEIGRDVLQ